MEINNAADFCKKGLDIPSQFTKDATSAPFRTFGDTVGNIAAAPIDILNIPLIGLIDFLGLPDGFKDAINIPSQFTKDATSSPFYTVGDIAGSIAAAPIDTGNRPISGLIDNVASIFSGE